jgi:hypothetical protein
MVLIISPSDYRIFDRLFLSDSACNSMLLLIDSGGLISFISYLMHSIPHLLLAAFNDYLIFVFKVSLSSNVLSKTSLPISDLIDVYANKEMAFIGFFTA